DFVGTLAGEHDRDLLPRELAELRERHRVWMTQWLIATARQHLRPRQEVRSVGSQDVKIRARAAGAVGRQLSLIPSAVLSLESDGKRIQAGAGKPGRVLGDQSGIDTAAAEHTEWHVAHELPIDGQRHATLHLLDGLVERDL